MCEKLEIERTRISMWNGMCKQYLVFIDCLVSVVRVLSGSQGELQESVTEGGGTR